MKLKDVHIIYLVSADADQYHSSACSFISIANHEGELNAHKLRHILWKLHFNLNFRVPRTLPFFTGGNEKYVEIWKLTRLKITAFPCQNDVN